MKVKAAITEGAPEGLFETFGSKELGAEIMDEVCEDALGAEAHGNPAAFYMQKPDETVNIDDEWGVELRMTGVSRGDRTEEQFNDALTRLHTIAKQAIAKVLKDNEDEDDRSVQLFTVLMIDGDVRTDDGVWTNTHEKGPEWVSAEDFMESEEAEAAAAGAQS